MKELASWISSRVLDRAMAARTGGGEVRLIFHGPPLAILDAVFEQMVTQTGELGIPVVLQVPELPEGTANPRVGMSGRCDEGHLLDLRNSPGSPSYLALVPPGERAIMSVSSTTDEFGMSSSSDGGDTAFDQWWDEPFVQAAVSDALDKLGLAQSDRTQADRIVARAARAADEADEEPRGRSAAWRMLSRIFGIPGRAIPPAIGLSLACGVPPMASSELSADEQQGALDAVASALSDGFRAGLKPAMQVASEEQERWLAAFLVHIRASCSLPTALERAAEPFYLPDDGHELGGAPEWWLGLTAETWATLLADEPEIESEIALEVMNALLPPTRGVPLVVEDAVELALRAGAVDDQPVPITLERSPGKNAAGFPMLLDVAGEACLADATPPPHKSPLQYKASAGQHRPAIAKVISLANWSPGFLVVSRQARKVVPPRAPSGRSKGASYETSISLPGPGRYELLVLLAPGVDIAGPATGTGGEGTASEEIAALPIRELKPSLRQLEVEVDGAYQLDLAIIRPGGQPGKPEIGRVFLSCEDVVEDGCRSEFERLIKLNRRQFESRGSKPIVQLDRTVRTSMLQGWMLQESSAASSYLPLVLAEDYADHWAEPRWPEEQGRILSGGRYLTDPRPPASQFDPPAAFIKARVELAAMLRGDDHARLVEAAPLGAWLGGREEFAATLERYLDAYSGWLAA